MGARGVKGFVIPHTERSGAPFEGSLYRPRTAAAARRLRRVMELAEDSYFGQWSEARFRAAWHLGTPGEFKLDQGLWGTSPGPATYLKEPCLDTTGRKE